MGWKRRVGCLLLGLQVELTQLLSYGLGIERAFILVEPMVQAECDGQGIAVKAIALYPFLVAAQELQYAQQPQAHDGSGLLARKRGVWRRAVLAGHGIS